MPSIKISELDLTTPGQNNTTGNVAYIPGYAIMGPINEPTYCETVAQFQSIFGKKPYVFRSNANNTVTVGGKEFSKLKDDYETSYIYATELLQRGLPIIFERFFTSSNISTWTASASLGGYIISSRDTVTLTSSLYDPQLTYYSDSEATTQLTNIDSLINNPSVTVYVGADTSSAVEVTLTYRNYYNYINDPDVAYKFYSYDNGTYTELTIVSGWSTGTYYTAADTAIDLVPSNYNPNNRYYVFEDGKYVEQLVGTGSEGTFYYGPVDSTSNAIIFTSKNPGLFSENLSIEVKELNGTYTAVIELAENINLGSEKQKETLIFNFDKDDADYYRNLTSNLCDINFTSDDIIRLDSESLNNSISFALPDTTVKSSDEFTISNFYNFGLTSVFDKLVDKGEYQIKFITTGSYPVLGITDVTSNLLSIAEGRSDCIALIDHANYLDTEATSKSGQLLTLVNNLSGNELKYGAIFTPWATYQNKITKGTSFLPASFAYLKCLAQSTATNPNWYAAAGISRGLVADLLQPAVNITGAVSDLYQSDEGISINPIINIKPYGYCIWGNRTLIKNIDGLTASSFLNVRVLVSDVKKVLFQACRSLTFENNTDVLWLNFKAAIEPTLDRMVTGNGLLSYKLIRQQTTKKATVVAIVRLVTVEAVENWDITVELTDSYVAVE